MKKRTAALALALLLCLTQAANAELHGSISLECDCEKKRCVCFIQLGDEGDAVAGIIDRLIEHGYLAANLTSDTFDAEVEKAVKALQAAHGFAQTGTMDDATLTYLLWGESPTETDVSSIEGIWIPTDGGIRRHINSTCCDMKDPRKVSIRNAKELGFQPCGKCNKGEK